MNHSMGQGLAPPGAPQTRPRAPRAQPRTPPRWRRVERGLERGLDRGLPATVVLALAAALLTLLAGCGGSDDPAPVDPNPNAALSAEQVGTAQAALEPVLAALDAGAAALTAAQVEAQRLALDGAALDAASTIEAKQAALDAAEALVAAF